MAGLPWMKVASTMNSDPDVLEWREKYGRAGAQQLKAAFIDVLGYCVANGTDGRFPLTALPFTGATKTDLTRLATPFEHSNGPGWLVPVPKGFEVRSFAEHQQTRETAAIKREMQSNAAKTTNAKRACKRDGHAPDCRCWAGEKVKR